MTDLKNETGKQIQASTKVYDLELRTKKFARDCRLLVRNILKDIPNREDSKQLVRSSGSVAANYIEANESLSQKDFVYRIKVCRKEAKESRLWLDLILLNNQNEIEVQKKLVQETIELVKIFSTIISKSE
jgi:four helix bundle protein